MWKATEYKENTKTKASLNLETTMKTMRKTKQWAVEPNGILRGTPKKTWFKPRKNLGKPYVREADARQNLVNLDIT